VRAFCVDRYAGLQCVCVRSVWRGMLDCILIMYLSNYQSAYSTGRLPLPIHIYSILLHVSANHFDPHHQVQTKYKYRRKDAIEEAPLFTADLLICINITPKARSNKR